MTKKTKILLLVVEDEAALAEMYAKKLRVEGFEVDVAHDGLEGFDKMKQEKPKLVLMDIMMPNLNGLEALKLAKKDAATRNIPVIMLTNLTGTAELEAALKEGAVGYIVKSELIPSEVVKRVRGVLNTKTGRQARSRAS